MNVYKMLHPMIARCHKHFFDYPDLSGVKPYIAKMLTRGAQAVRFFFRLQPLRQLSAKIEKSFQLTGLSMVNRG